MSFPACRRGHQVPMVTSAGVTHGVLQFSHGISVPVQWKCTEDSWYSRWSSLMMRMRY